MLNIPYEKRSGYYNALERSQIKKDEKYFWNGFLEDTCTNIKITSNIIKVNLPAAPFRLYSIRVPISNHVEFQIFQTQ
ncbi:hypothetical protein C5S42_00330 [Candidatus Methanomarinus sp.]|nr:hypothetical protein C5S42_00330 [ANME-2 cluster archaeon]